MHAKNLKHLNIFLSVAIGINWGAAFFFVTRSGVWGLIYWLTMTILLGVCLSLSTSAIKALEKSA
jgi:lipoprotein signal peptidase